MHRLEGEKQENDEREEPTPCNAQWQPRCEYRRPKAKRRSKTKNREMINHKCNMRCEVVKAALTHKVMSTPTKS